MNLQEALQRAKSERKETKEEVRETKIAESEEKVERILVESYSDVRVFKQSGEPLYLYEIPSPHLKGEERSLINTLLEIAAGVISEGETYNLNKEEKKAKYLHRVLEIIANTPELKIPIHAKQFYAEAVVKEMAGYGLIDPLVDDDFLEEIMIIGPGKPVFVFHRKYEMMKTNIIFYEDRDIQNLIDKMARTVGRRIDIQSPLLDARLPDGSRVNATIPPASINGSTITLRKFRKDPFTVIDLIKYGTLDFDVAAFLWVISDGFGALPANILVSGGTASGKTSTLNVLASFIPKDERIVSIEDTAELSLPLDHWIRMEVRPASAEGTGEINMDTLVKNSLRMRPDRIIVGEIRGQEGFTLFTAMNTGHRGAVTGDTLINLADGKIERIEALAGKYFNKERKLSEGEFEFVEIYEPLEAISFNRHTLQLERKRITRIWRKKTEEKLMKIKFRSGKLLSLTEDHPVYKIYEGIQELAAADVKSGDYLAFPYSTKAKSQKNKLSSHGAPQQSLDLIYDYEDDLIPNISNIIGNALGSGAYSQQTAMLSKNNDRLNYMMKSGVSRKTLRELTEIAGNYLSRQLKLLADAPVGWDEVATAERVDFDGYVYDLTVEDNHTYIANELIVSNCLGTVHANSAHETLVRLESPPILVPRIMIGALNFIIMQHRLHDRRKGVIRRITEIAEVSQDESEQPHLQMLYQWDASKDKLLPTGLPSTFLQTLATFTGLQREDILQEIENRKKILVDLSAKGIRGIEEVCNITQNYVLQKKGKI